MTSELTQTTTRFRAQLMEDDEFAWATFVERHRPVLLRIANRVGLNPTLAEDAAQDTLMTFRNSYLQGNYDPTRGSRLRSWLYGIAERQSRNTAKGMKKGGMPVNGEGHNSLFENIPADKLESAFEEEYRAEISKRVRAVLESQLSERDYQVVILGFQGWSGKRIAEAMDLTEQNVFVIRARAFKKAGPEIRQIDQDY